MPRKKDLIGLRFGRLVVIRECGRTKNGAVLWLCKCDCGGELKVTSSALNFGSVQSCGCLRLDRCKEVCTKHGLNVSHARLMSSVRTHITFIRCDTNPKHKTYKHLMIPAKYLGNSGVVRFVQEVIKRYPKEAEEYERNKNLELDKDIVGCSVFAPWGIHFVTREDNQSYRRNTQKMIDTPLAKVCREEGISTRSLEYHKIARVWRERSEIHPILWIARKQNLEKEEHLLEATKLRCRRVELMIKGLREFLASR